MTTNSPNPVDGDVQARKQKRSDHSKLAVEIVHNLVSTDSCDEEVTEKLIAWVLNRLNKEFPTPHAQDFRVDDILMLMARLVRAIKKHQPDSDLVLKAVDYLNKNGCSSPLRQQGTEVKND